MIYREAVRGTQARMPDDIEINGKKVYARAKIERIDEEDTTEEPGFHGWQYEEAILTAQEFDALKALDFSWVELWSDAMRTAERRARYERMDPKVSSLRRRLDLDPSDTEAKEKLMDIQAYCKAVTDTQEQEGYPLQVTYPDEPEV